MINVDTVYQRVLALANKEQRGYITPQEFNLFANMAQTDIFEQYFYDLNQHMRLPTNGVEYSDILELINEKISLFKVGPTTMNSQVAQGVTSFNLPGNLHRLGTIVTNDSEATEINRDKLLLALRSPLTAPTNRRPVYTKTARQIQVFNDGSGNPTFDLTTCTYLRRPARARWGYVVVEEKALYDANNSSNFQIHHSDITELTYKIATLAGVSMKHPMFKQQVAAENVVKSQQEKI